MVLLKMLSIFTSFPHWVHPDPGIEPGSPALYADSLPSEPLGKPTFTSLPLYQFFRIDILSFNSLFSLFQSVWFKFEIQ